MVDSSALLESHQVLSKINSRICTNLWYIYKIPLFPTLWPLFSEAAFSTVYSWRTKYKSNWQSFWKYYWGGDSRSQNHYFCMECFIPNTNTGGSWLNCFALLPFTPMILGNYTALAETVHWIGNFSLIGGLDCTCQQKWEHLVILMNLKGKSSGCSPKNQPSPVLSFL